MKKAIIFSCLVVTLLILSGRFFAERWITESGVVIDIDEEASDASAYSSSTDSLMTEQDIKKQNIQQMKKRFENLVNDLLERARSFFAEAESPEELQQVWTDRVEDFQAKINRFSAYPEYGYTLERAQKMLDAFVSGLNGLYEKRLHQLQFVPEAPQAPWEQ